MLNRKEYGVGGIAKALIPVVKRVAKVFTKTDSEKEIKNRLNKVINKIESAPLGSSKKETFKKIAEQENVTLGFVKDANKINSYRSGGGKGENIFAEIKQLVRSKTTKPTSGQADAEALGGGRYTREANIKAADAGSIGLGVGSLLGSGATLGFMKAWDSQNDSAPTEKEASAFEKAFSKAHNTSKETFMFKGKKYSTDVRKGKAEGGDVSADEKRQNKYNREVLDALEKNPDNERLKAIKESMTPEDLKAAVLFKQPKEKKAEGGSSMLVPPEMGLEEEEEMPVDTFTPEEQATSAESQLPDDQMEDDYMGFMLDESLDETEQQYLMGVLESDPRLSEIFDKVITTASEFSGAGEVEGPGTGVSDSIPARLSDGEFVITEEATSELGADNLQTMMDDAERKASGGKASYAEGGLLDNPYGSLMKPRQDEDLVKKSMLGANRMPSLMGTR